MSTNRFIVVFLLLFHLGAFGKPLVLQLKGGQLLHYSGYYVAQWQGFYQDEGLDVEIRLTKPQSALDPVDEVASGRADFSVGGIELFLAQDSQYALSLLAPVFQRSPLGLYSLDHVPLNSVSKLASLKIGIDPSGLASIQVSALMMSRGFSKDNIEFVSAPANVDTLLSGKADVVVMDGFAASYQAKAHDLQLNQMGFADYGIEFYSDSIYTSAKFLRENPEVARKFAAASLRGWQYTLENLDAAYDWLRKSDLLGLNIKDSDRNQHIAGIAKHLKDALQYPSVKLGQFNHSKWLAMHERLRALGIIYATEPNPELLSAVTPQEPMIESSSFGLVILALIAVSLGVFFLYRQTVVFAVLSLVIAVVVLAWKVELYSLAEGKREQRLQIEQKLESTTAKLEGILRNNIAMITGFAAYLAASPDMSDEAFNAYARELFRTNSFLINFASAKDLVINHVYPLKGHEQIIGLDYRDIPTQKDMVDQVMSTGQLLVVGPVNLIQGGVAFIGRAPVFTGEGKNRRLWGLVSAPIDANELYERSGINLLAQEVNLAIRTYDSLGNQGPVFFGDAAVFDDPWKVQKIIAIGGGTWHLAITNKSKLAGGTSWITLLWFLTILFVLMACAGIAYRINKEKEKEELELELREHRNLLEKVGSVAKIAGWKMNLMKRFSGWSPQVSALFNQPSGFNPGYLLDIRQFFKEQDFELLDKCILNPFTSLRPIDLEFELSVEPGRKRWFRFVVGVDPAMRNQLLITVQDVSEKTEAANYIRHQATFDSLTNLPNRLLFNDRLGKALDMARRTESQLAVLFIDLDQFKSINDNYGHRMGDSVLLEVAKRLNRSVRNTDTVSRLSGDEFGVIIVNIKHFESAVNVAENINATLQQLYHLNEHDLHLTASVGIALYPQDGDETDVLIRKADQAMYEVKNSGRNGWQFFTETMQRRSEYRHALLYDLIIALNNEEFVPHFQPIHRVKDGHIVKCESLVRWLKSDGSFVSPVEFIPIAEESGLINKIDLWMLKASAKAIIKLNKDFEKNMGLSVNVSPRLFQTKDKALQTWLEVISEIADKISLTVEITERLLTDESKNVLMVLKQLRSWGVKVALDDFGTGYSSLSYLVQFPVDIVKIDRSFVSRIGEKVSAESLIETILIMAKKLKLEVVAEGIETQRQFDFLKQRHCQQIQGYYLNKPMPERDLMALLSDKVLD